MAGLLDVSRYGWDVYICRLLFLMVLVCCFFQLGRCNLTALPVDGKHTSQSTIWSPHESYQAIDGYAYTFSHTDNNDPHPWWLLDLGSNHNLSRINVILRKDSGGFRFTGAIGRAGLSPNFTENLPCGSPATSEQSQDGAEIPFLCEPPRTARYISLDIDTSMPGVDAAQAYLQLAEVTVENVTSGEGAALPVYGKTTSQSTTWDSHPSYKAIDGQTDTYTHTDENDPHPWWLLDLGRKHCLGRITVTLRTDGWGFRFIGAIVRAGLSPNFTENLPCGSPATSNQSQNGAVIPFLCETPRTARYVSLDIDDSMPSVNPTAAFLQIAEVAVEEYTSGECAAPGYLGCFGDAKDRSLTVGPAIEYNEQSVEWCFRNCLERTEYKYAGLEFEHECWCGNEDYDKHGKAPDSDCQDLCTGNSDQICGGDWLLSVYRVSQGVCSNDIGPPTNGEHTITNPRSLSYNLINFKFFGTSVDFSCYHGYTLHGASSIECIETGYNNVTWSDSVPTCEDNVCSNPNLCRNGGTCIPETTGNFYNCSCPAGFSGGDCQNDVCSNPNPCQNGGTCIPDTSGNFYNCFCPAGFSGGDCQTDDPCMSNPCQNGGQCMPQAENMYNCTCQNGATGNNCQNAHSNTKTIIIVVLVVVVIVVLVIVVVCFVKRSRRKRRGSLPSAVDRGRGQELIQKKLSNIYWIDTHQASTSEFNGPSKEFPRDKLHILGQLGSGSFAVVYKAEAEGITRRGTNTTVAVKMLKEFATPNDQSDFKKELQMYSMMDQHPNVLSMLGYCTDKDPMYIILEYVPHGDLQTYLRHIRTGTEPFYLKKEEFKEKKDLTPTEILTFASQVVRGMEYLASKQCIHRDLATRNILLGEGLICKVSDFGLAREVAEKSQYEMQSQGKVPVRWMAPESLLSNMYTSKSDVWSFGVLLWELVTLGSHPYPGMSSQEVINELKKGYRLPKPEHCGDDIYQIMMDCWQEKPEDRPDFAGLHTTIDDILADAAGYLEMGNLNPDDYVYLKPGQGSRSTTHSPTRSPTGSIESG
ncbi:muscle, skeletal receptor tyrosine protein kinase-like [Patiria miniata]|uniref:Receptor protein-tyrosine kinase n=1 Tax=Patiria miniata TaxID=46514 RepID=A0A914AM89_PATMI|nr:muscle, skeletal receptor tyrosine protein kinase-like [Patiria miniata]